MGNGSFNGHSKRAVESGLTSILFTQRKRMAPPCGKGWGDPDGTLKQHINGRHRPQRGGHAESCLFEKFSGLAVGRKVESTTDSMSVHLSLKLA